jgi:hypothetical protein
VRAYRAGDWVAFSPSVRDKRAPKEMVTATKPYVSGAAQHRSPKLLQALSIDEARILVQRCAEPRPPGDRVKAAIRRASRVLDMPFSRTRDLWYRAARRVEADEMDRLRRTARHIEVTQAVAAIEVLKFELAGSCSPLAREAAAGLSIALRAIECDVRTAS